MEESMAKKINVKEKEMDSKSDAGKEVENIMNSVMKKKIENGDIPKTTTQVLVKDFAGKVLKRTKSVFVGGTQYFVNAGTKWEDVEKFMRKNTRFTDADF